MRPYHPSPPYQGLSKVPAGVGRLKRSSAFCWKAMSTSTQTTLSYSVKVKQVHLVKIVDVNSWEYRVCCFFHRIGRDGTEMRLTGRTWVNTLFNLAIAWGDTSFVTIQIVSNFVRTSRRECPRTNAPGMYRSPPITSVTQAPFNGKHGERRRFI